MTSKLTAVPGLAIGCLLFAGLLSLSSGQETGTDGRLRAYAQLRVFKIVSKTAKTEESGTAILLHVAKREGPGGKDVGTFVTAYHVLQSTRGFSLWDFRNRPVGKSSDATDYYPDRLNELAFVRLPLDPAGGVQYQHLKLEPAVDLVSLTGERIANKPGRAFGFPGRSGPLEPRTIRFADDVTAKSLGGLVDEKEARKFMKTGGKSAPTGVLFRKLYGDPAADGMSGGLVVGIDERFGGIVVGRQPGEYNVAVPAESVIASWEAARAKPEQGWARMKESPLESKSLYNGGRRLSDDERLKRIDELSYSVQQLANTLAVARLLADKIPDVDSAPAKETANELRKLLANYRSSVPTGDLSDAVQESLRLAEKRIQYIRGEYKKLIEDSDLKADEDAVEAATAKLVRRIEKIRIEGRAYYALEKWAEVGRAFQIIRRTPYVQTADHVMWIYSQHQLKRIDIALKASDEVLGKSGGVQRGTSALDTVLLGGLYMLRAEMRKGRNDIPGAAADTGVAAAAFGGIATDGRALMAFGWDWNTQLMAVAGQLHTFRASDLADLEKKEESLTAFGEGIDTLEMAIRFQVVLQFGRGKEGAHNKAAIDKLPLSIARNRRAVILARSTRAVQSTVWLLEELQAGQVKDLRRWYDRYARVLEDYKVAASHAESLKDQEKAIENYKALSNALGDRGWEVYKRGMFKEGAEDLYARLDVLALLIKKYDTADSEAFTITSGRLAWIRATCPDAKLRDGQFAVVHATAFCKRTKWSNSSALRALAAAYAEDGNFDKAVEFQKKAIDLALAPQKGSLRKEFALYERKQPYREDPRKK
jgi:tetratricopeptide (TPR) repeat protein